MTHTPGRTNICILALCLALAFAGCKKAQNQSAGVTCDALSSGASWTPAPSGPSASYHDATVTVAKTVVNTTGTVVGAAQASTGKEIAVDITISQDLGVQGSLTLVAKTTNWPAALKGDAYPLLVSLMDPNGHDWITPAAACASAGYFSCPGGVCSQNSSCTVTGAFSDRDHWEQHNVVFSGYSSVNSFPTCNWSITSPGSPSAIANPDCAFTTNSWLASGKLPMGTYHAKYVLLAGNYSSLSGTYTSGLQVTAVQKKDAGANAGTIDMNIVLVGNKIINASRTAKGQANLDLLLSMIYSEYSAQAGIKIGTVRAIEWPCDAGGDSYSEISTSSLGDMIAAGQSVLPASADGNAVNIFMINSFTNSSSVLGISGGIGGAPVNGHSSSGVAVATYGSLDKYNPLCADSNCPLASQELGFANLVLTVSHEMGHFLGLNHPSETAGGTATGNHDIIDDTPICTTVDPIANQITTSSCRTLDSTNQKASIGGGGTCNSVCSTYSNSSGTYCPSAAQCGFNHLMWPWSKNFKEGTGAGDGNLLSTNSKTLVNFNPIVQ